MKDSMIIDNRGNADLLKFLITQIVKSFPKAKPATNLIEGQDRYVSFHDSDGDDISGWTSNDTTPGEVARSVKPEREFFDAYTEIDKILAWLEWKSSLPRPISFKIAGYESSISENGDVKIGCTRITQVEIENFINLYKTRK